VFEHADHLPVIQKEIYLIMFGTLLMEVIRKSHSLESILVLGEWIFIQK
jgi:hypothetical protein